jgi:outer membrane lipoprotein carrier protein
MKLRSLLLALLFFIFQPVMADTASDALAKNLTGYTSYSANFTQINYDGKKHAGQKSQGRVYMLRPGRFRWETIKPYQQTVIANGDTLWIYDVDLGQASQQSLAKRGFNPAQLLTEPVGDLTQKFTVTQEDDGWFKLIPNKTGRGFKVAYLQFRDHQLTGLKIINQLNQTNVFSFSQIQINPNLAANLFKLKTNGKVQIIK